MELFVQSSMKAVIWSRGLFDRSRVKLVADGRNGFGG